jgi:hypothetical protein
MAFFIRLACWSVKFHSTDANMIGFNLLQAADSWSRGRPWIAQVFPLSPVHSLVLFFIFRI